MCCIIIIRIVFFTHKKNGNQLKIMVKEVINYCLMCIDQEVNSEKGMGRNKFGRFKVKLFTS